MRVFAILSTIAALLTICFYPTVSWALSSPILSSPSPNSVLSQSPQLIWTYSGECIASGSCFRVEINSSETFDSLEKYFYTNNTNYSPQDLESKKWFWRVKAKDSTEKWSEWSNIGNFTLVSGQNIVPSPTSTPTPSPTPLPTPTNTPIPTKPSQIFTIQSIPSQITSSQSFNVIINIDHATVNTNYLLKGAFVKEESSNYFGKTKVAGNWIENNLTCTSQVSITTDSSGNWTGSLEVITDPDDSGFTGNGDYLFKVGRYGSNCSNLSWSNVANIYISDDRPPTETNSTSQTTPSPTPIPTAVPITELFLLDESIDNATLSSLPKIPLSLLTTSATVAGVSTYSSILRHDNPTKVEAIRVLNPYVIFGIIILLLSGATVIIKKNKNLYEIVKSFNISSWYIQLLHLKKPKNWDKLWHKITKKAQSWRSLVP